MPADYLLTMNDSWGDGWNGNVMTIGDVTYTMEEGSELVAGAGAAY